MTSNRGKNIKPSSLYEWAIFYCQQWGAAIIPLRQGKIPTVQWGKFQKQQPTPDDYKRWFLNSQPWGVAIICGEVSGNLIRLDFDDPTDYEKLKDRLPKGTPVFRSQRPTGGYGAILRSSTPVPKLPEGTFKDYPKLGVNGEGSITVVPPTPGYEWISPPVSVPTIDTEEWLREHCGYNPQKKGARLAELAGITDGTGDDRTEETLAAIAETREGGRNNALVRLASYLRWHRLPVRVAAALLRPVVDGWGGDPIGDEEFERTIESAYKYDEQMNTEGEHANVTSQRKKSTRVGKSILPKVDG